MEQINKNRKIFNFDTQVFFIGHPFAPIGMGSHLRYAFKALKAVHPNTFVFDVYKINKKSEFTDDILIDSERNTSRSAVNIYCINGDEVDDILKAVKNNVRGSIYNIIYPAWELPIYPSVWGEKLDLFDEIWSTSEYTKNSISKSVRKKVYRIPLPCECPVTKFNSRKKYSIPESSFVFLCSFDPKSYIERKNPFAVIEAFSIIVEANPELDIILFLKINGEESAHNLKKYLSKYSSMVNNRIIVFGETLVEDEMRSLMSLCDCYVSPHRAEGFGLGIAESMYHGIPVIATGYSGNMEFCNEQNSLLLKFKLEEVAPGAYPFSENQTWASPLVEDLVEKMLYVAMNQGTARKIGKAGEYSIKNYLNFNRIGLKYLSKISESLSCHLPFEYNQIQQIFFK